MVRNFKNKMSELPDDFPTFEEMIESAKKRFDLPPEVWKPFDDAIARRAAKHKKTNEYIISLRDFSLSDRTEKVKETKSRNGN